MKQALWREYFHFSKRERQGIIVLIALTAICLCIPRLWEHYYPPQVTTDSTFHAEVAAFRTALAAKEMIPVSRSSYKRSRYTPAAGELFYFDPNTLTTQGWQQLGLPARTIQTIQHYLAKGGRFRKKEDLQRVYGLRPDLYQRLAPYVQIMAGKRDTIAVKAVRPAFVPRAPVVIDINEADSAAWEALSGIGPVLAGRIVKFRDKLGGFYAVTQVAETFSLPDSTFKKIQSSLQLHSSSLKKIDINLTDERTLAQHPYIRYKLARLIVLYRSNNGGFSHPGALRKIPLVNDSIYRKLEPYIKQ